MGAQYGRHRSRDAPETRGGHPDALDANSESDFKRAEAEPASLQPSRRAAAERLPHEETEIERARVDEQPLQDVLMPAQVSAAEPTSLVHVSERALDVLAATPHEPLASRAAHAPSVAVDWALRLRRLGPVPPAAVGLGDVGPHG